MDSAKKHLAKNTIMVYMLNVAKIIFPLLTLPYLTRTLSVDVYGVVAYSKAIMSYVELFIDFGFMLSATRELIEVRNDIVKINTVLIETTIARLLLALLGAIGVAVFTMKLSILNGWAIYMLLTYTSIVLNVFLFDYYFQAIENMQLITIRFVIVKFISVVLTLFFVNSDGDVLNIAFFDLLSSLVAALFTIDQMKNILFCRGNYTFRSVMKRLSLSASYFLSTAAAQCFSGINTIFIGILLSPTEVAYWSLSIQGVSVIQSLFKPVITSLYPYMLKNNDVGIIKLILKRVMPVIAFGCFLIVFLGTDVITFILGDKYQRVGEIITLLIPVLLCSFPAMILGWPTLGSIKKVREVTITTVYSAGVQFALLIFMYYASVFSLFGIIIVRNITELNLLLSRVYYCWVYRDDLTGGYGL